MLLAKLPDRKSRRQVYRLTVVPDQDDYINELQFDPEGSEEIRNMLIDAGLRIHLNDLLDAPFKPRKKIRQTRFSDGSFELFYSSLEIRTAESEVKYWCPTFMKSAKSSRTAFYVLFECTFDGVEKDLRLQKSYWPDLVHPTDYAFCNQIGNEAKALSLDGVVTYSARLRDGANMPVFSRSAIGSPREHNWVAITYEPSTGAVSLHRFPPKP